MHIALTGGATGIGKSLVQKLTNAGHSVTAFDVAEPEGPIKRWIQTDLGDPASISAALELAEGPFGALINNAGLPPREGMAELVLNVNFIGFRQFLVGMLDKLEPNAAIVNTASRAGAGWFENLEEVKAFMALNSVEEIKGYVEEHGIDHVRAYNLSKEAMIVLTLASTEDMIARGFRMNCVSPAAVSTGILEDFKAAFGERMAVNVARAGRPGQPDEIADIIVFLAGPQSAWMKGVDVTIDGGMSAMAQTDKLKLLDTWH